MATWESERKRFKRERACKRCEWYEHYFYHLDSYGHCKRRAPEKPDSTILQNQWPNVHEDEWCGEYHQKFEGE